MISTNLNLALTQQDSEILKKLYNDTLVGTVSECNIANAIYTIMLSFRSVFAYQPFYLRFSFGAQQNAPNEIKEFFVALLKQQGNENNIFDFLLNYRGETVIALNFSQALQLARLVAQWNATTKRNHLIRFVHTDEVNITLKHTV